MTFLYIMQFLIVRQNITIQFKETQTILSIASSHILRKKEKKKKRKKKKIF